MLSFDPKNHTEREIYKLMIGTIVPRPIAFVTSVAKNGTINGAPFSYFNSVAPKPPLISISVNRKNGVQKDTARNIVEQKQYVIHIVDEDNVEQINKTAASLPADESEINQAELTLAPSEVIQTPGIKEAKVRLECVLEKHIELGEDGETATDFIIGKIVRIHLDPSIYNDGKIIYDELKAVSRLAGNDYAKMGDVFTIKRPK